MSTPDFTDSFGFEYFNQRVSCCKAGCKNEGIEVTVLALPEGVIICGVCNSQLHELADDVVVTPPVIVLPVLEEPEELPLEDLVVEAEVVPLNEDTPTEG